MNQLKSIYNSPFKDLHAHPIQNCFPIIASNVTDPEITSSYIFVCIMIFVMLKMIAFIDIEVKIFIEY